MKRGFRRHHVYYRQVISLAFDKADRKAREMFKPPLDNFATIVIMKAYGKEKSLFLQRAFHSIRRPKNIL